MKSLEELPNIATFNAWAKCERHFIDHHKILISLSGGSDSDDMLDFLLRVRQENTYNYRGEMLFVFFDTGIESQATKEHLDFLEQKYNIKIERIRAKVPVPLGCKKYGLPFISKDTSAKINSLQNNNFDFANDGNKSFEELSIKYPKCKSVIKWWCNVKKSHNIKDNKYLKEFMIANPPEFKISERCCNGAKKSPSEDYEKLHNIDLKCLGLRKIEGGVRATKFNNCFTPDYERKGKQKGFDDYRPIWWFSDKDKKEYEEFFGVTHSRCYTEYGFKRTGCMGCPFNSKWQEDLEILKVKEPLLYKAVTNIFAKSYEYTLKYREFKKKYGGENE